MHYPYRYPIEYALHGLIQNASGFDMHKGTWISMLNPNNDCLCSQLVLLYIQDGEPSVCTTLPLLSISANSHGSANLFSNKRSEFQRISNKRGNFSIELGFQFLQTYNRNLWRDIWIREKRWFGFFFIWWKVFVKEKVKKSFIAGNWISPWFNLSLRKILIFEKEKLVFIMG